MAILEEKLIAEKQFSLDNNLCDLVI